MKKLIFLPIILVVSLTTASTSYSHCEIPCGIYDDSARFVAMREHVTTIEKSLKQILELSSGEKTNYNQLVRWVMNKENHADALQEIVTQYFLFQRLQPVGESDPAKRNRYLKQLSLLHQVAVNAMKAKQSTEIDYIEKLRADIADFEAAYFAK